MLPDPLSGDYSAYELRKRYPQDQGWQDLLGPLEHRQFMRETTRNDPLTGTGAMFGSLAYSYLKALSQLPWVHGHLAKRIVESVGTGEMKTSNPSWDEVFGAWQGYREGLGE